MNATTSLKPFDPASIPSRLAYGFQPLKPRTLGRDLRDLFTFIWTQDTETFDHPRYRLQTALAIQLVYYLGLHPTVALSEGFYYQDTRLLLKKHNNTVRVLLLICLEGREKFPKTEKHWRGGTMILTDLPRDRHICPVTLFLALAIVDGAIEGINCSDDFSTLAGQDWSGCITLPFNSTVSHLSIFRRTGSKSKTISSCAMKPSAVYKMMQAQMIRAGHENTLSNMVHDVKKSSRRFTQHAWQSEKPLVIGRGQAEDVSELLGQIVEIHSTTPIVSYDSVTPRPLKVIPELVKIQLRYDSSRRDIISCLYGMRSMYGQVIDMLWCFVNAAVSVAPEPFYKDALPDANDLP
ncbi:hypothetical protein T440DRAFT_519030 [Plenodomus tracheiphilus IPT5]|uniref:Uncharacterized protein n=1 Tax=Plenodomus tracheiphilus IPT5 TaxID=1408161 RepID=A0A6A7B220_9PLEO|nr:hypothetical protein T440DRAFT_519030 [Plenodomus tracheiphilus IPT5]